MIDDHDDLDRKYRSPRVFGPMPGPRNVPLSQRAAADRPVEVTTSLTVSVEADPHQLARLLPPDTRLSGPAVLTVTAARFENLRWLAGRGYPILSVTFPVEYTGGADPVTGRFLAVLWEGLADPITTGREELGFPKLPADIDAPLLADVSPGGAVRAGASWDGFRFLDLTARELTDAPASGGAPPAGTIVHRYVPSLESPDRADIDQLVHHPPAAGGPAVTDHRTGTGQVTFHHARFADVPVQYPVINALADLTLAASGPATLTRTTGAVAGSRPRVLGAGTRHPAGVGR